jgi:hypothetical protein
VQGECRTGADIEVVRAPSPSPIAWCSKLYAGGRGEPDPVGGDSRRSDMVMEEVTRVMVVRVRLICLRGKREREVIVEWSTSLEVYRWKLVGKGGGWVMSDRAISTGERREALE